MTPTRFENLVELLRARAAYGSRVAFTFLAEGETEGPHLTYEELEKRARSIAAFLQSQGAAGQRALLFYPPGLDFLTAFWGCVYAGVIGVPVFPARLASASNSPAFSQTWWSSGTELNCDTNESQ